MNFVLVHLECKLDFWPNFNFPLEQQISVVLKMSTCNTCFQKYSSLLVWSPHLTGCGIFNQKPVIDNKYT